MKLVLLALDSDEERAKAVLERRFAGARIEIMPRKALSNTAQALQLARRFRPDIFAVSMENLASQRGLNLLSLFSILTGARKQVTLDARGALKIEGRLNSLLRFPFRLIAEAWLSGLAILRSHVNLGRLERAVKDRTYKSVSASRLAPSEMEVVFVRSSPGPGTQIGGASSHITGFINAAVDAGAFIRMVTNDRIAGLDNPAVEISVVPLEAAGLIKSAYDLHNNLRFTRGAVEEISRRPPHLIYQRYGRFTWAGVAASLVTGKPLFLEYNGSEVWVGKHWDSAGMFSLLERVEQLNLSAAARIFVVSEVERRNLLAKGIASTKIVVNPNGVDVEKFRPNVGGDKVRTELLIERDEILVGFVGTFGPWHGVLELASAIALIPKKVRMRFLLVGAGQLKEQMESLIRERGLSERVIFTGAVTHDRVPALLDACDVLTSPHIPLQDGSDFFGSPTKIFEYMAMAKGLVASRLGQIGDVLTDGETALLVKPGDVTALSHALLRLAENSALRERLGHQARKVVKANYTWNHNAKRVLTEYQTWLNLERDRVTSG